MPSTPRITSDVSAAVPLAPQRFQATAAGQPADLQPFAAMLDDAMPKAMPHTASSTKATAGRKSSASPGATAAESARDHASAAGTSLAPDPTSDAQASSTQDDEAVSASNKPAPAEQPDSSITASTDATATAATANALNLAIRDESPPVSTAKTASASGKDDNSPATASANQSQPSVPQPAAAALLVTAGADGTAVPGTPNAADLPILAVGKTGLLLVSEQNSSARSAKDAAAAGEASTPDKADTGSTDNAGKTTDGPSSKAGAQQAQSQPPTPADDQSAAPTLTATPSLGGNNRAAALGNAIAATTTPATGQSGTPATTGTLNANALPNFGFVAANTANTAAPAPAAAADTAIPLAGLAVTISARAEAGSNRFDIRLDPPELGRIDVRLAVDGSGQVTTHVTVDRADTLQLLQNQQPQLERALQQAGLRTADNGLQFTLRDQSFAGQNGSGGGQQNTAQLVIPDAELAPVNTAQIYSRLRLGSGLDIRV